MLRTRKRVTRRDLRQPDKFLTLTGSVGRILREHKLFLSISLGCIVLAILIFIGLKNYRNRQNIEAAIEYRKALVSFQDKKYEEAIKILKPLADYRHTVYKDLALLYEGHSYISLRQPNKAINVLKEYLNLQNNHTLLRQLGLVSLGYAYEEVSQFTDAVIVFDQAYQIKGPYQEEALIMKAHCLEQIGKLNKALKTYQIYLLKFPDSSKINHYILRTKELEVKIGKSLVTQ